MRTLPFLLALAPLTSGCSSEDPTVAEITVLGHLTPCTTSEVLDCMLVDEGDGPQYFYDSIDGFTFHWGSTFRLEVEIVKVKNPVPDASSREVHLREILETEPVAPRSEFTLALRGEASPGVAPLLTAAGQGFTMPSGRQIACQAPEVCTAIANALGRPAPFDLTLRHPDDPTNEQAPLTPVAVVLR